MEPFGEPVGEPIGEPIRETDWGTVSGINRNEMESNGMERNRVNHRLEAN